MRSIVAVLLIAGLVALAGCSGGPLENDGETSGMDEGSYPDGYDVDGVTNATLAFRTHETAIQGGAGVNTTTTLSTDGVDLTQQYRASYESGRTFASLTFSDRGLESFTTADGTSYSRVYIGNRTEYSTTTVAGDRSVDLGLFLGLSADASATSTSMSTTDGTTIITYEFDSSDVALDADSRYYNTQTNGSIRGTLRVDKQGRIHELSLSVDADDGSKLSATVTNEFGEVTVDEPGWLDEARQETGNA